MEQSSEFAIGLLENKKARVTANPMLRKGGTLNSLTQTSENIPIISIIRAELVEVGDIS